MTHTIEIDPFSCCGHGDCVDAAPQVFQLQGDLATVIGEAPADELLRAAESCPSAAIAIVDAATGVQLYP